MNKLRTFGQVVALAVVAAACANSAEPPTQGDVVFPTGDAAWTVTFGGDESAKSGKPLENANQVEKKKVEIVRMGNLRRDVISWADGTTTELWWIEKPALALYDDKRSGVVATMKAGYLGNRRLDASSFAWVNSSNFVDQRSFKEGHGKKCNFHQMDVIGESQNGILRAWIDPDTHQPVALQTGLKPAVFQFGTPSLPEALVMPARFEKVLKEAVAALAPPKRLDKR